MQKKITVGVLEFLRPEELEEYLTVEFKVSNEGGANVKNDDIIKLARPSVPLPFLSFENLTSGSSGFFCLPDSVILKVL